MWRLDHIIREEWGTALARSWDHWVELPERAGDLVGELAGAALGQVLVTDNTTVTCTSWPRRRSRRGRACT